VQAFRVFMSRRSALDLSVECQRASAGPGAPSLGLSPQPVFAPHLATRESHVARTNPPESFCAPQASADALGGGGRYRYNCGEESGAGAARAWGQA
jgi:hypothetical protein